MSFLKWLYFFYKINILWQAEVSNQGNNTFNLINIWYDNGYNTL